MFHSYTQYRLFKQLALFTYWPTDSCSTATHSTGYSNSWHCSHTDWLIHVPQLHTVQAIWTVGIVHILTDWFMFHSYTQHRLLEQVALFTYWPTDSYSTATHSTGYSNSWHCSHTDRLIHIPQLHTVQAIRTVGIVHILTDWFMFHSYTQYRLFKQLALFTYWPTDSCSTATHSTGYSNSWHCLHTDRLIHVPQLHTTHCATRERVSQRDKHNLSALLQHSKQHHKNVKMIKQSGINSGLSTWFVLLSFFQWIYSSLPT